MAARNQAQNASLLSNTSQLMTIDTAFQLKMPLAVQQPSHHIYAVGLAGEPSFRFSSCMTSEFKKIPSPQHKCSTPRALILCCIELRRDAQQFSRNHHANCWVCM